MKKTRFLSSALSRIIRKASFFIVFLIMSINLNAQQYNVAGTAVAMSSLGCYQLTNALSQAGAVWNIYLINLTQPFDITLSLNFGNRPDIYWDNGVLCGADGMSFVLQPLSAGVFGSGSGVGFHGITPSVGIVMDTYHFNPSDPSFQHISIHKNGDELHATTNELVSYTSAVGFPSNITDGLDHLFRFTWTPTPSGVGTMNVYFGSSTTLPSTPTLTYTGNIVANIFSGNPNVFWGVSGSTGGCWNLQTVCMTTVSNFNANAVTCAGIPHNFTSNSISGLPITTYLWHFGDGDSSLVQNPIHTYNSSGTFNVDLTITNSGGFTSTMTHTVTVNPNPTVSISASANPICAGASTTLTASGALTYSWSGGLGTANPITVTPLSTTIYSVTGTTNGCIGIGYDTIVVNPLPIVSIAASTNPICQGTSSILTASGATTYAWNGGLGTTNPMSVSPATTTTFTVVGNSLGCLDTANIILTVNPNPIISITTSANPICNGDTTVLTVASNLAGTSYAWDNGLSGSPIIVNPSNTTTYTVMGTITSCTDTASVTIIVNPIPQVTISPINPSICIGDSISLIASSDLPSSSFTWSNTSTNSTINVSPLVTTSYYVVGIANQCIDTAFVDITVKPLPVITVTASDNPICEGESTTVTASSDLASTSFLWNNTSTLNSIYVTPAATSYFYATGTVNGCQDTAGIVINVIPHQDVYLGDDRFICDGDQVFLSANNLNGTYLWSTGSISNSISVSTSGLYWLVVNNNGCIASDSIFFESCSDIWVPNAFTPNGDNKNDFFKPVVMGSFKLSFYIYNKWGEILFKSDDISTGWDGNYMGKEVPQGVYVWMIQYYDSSMNQQKEKIIRGHVTLYR